jgi:O-antigen ligase
VSSSIIPLDRAGFIEFLGEARFASALSTLIVATAFFSHAIRETIGWPGLITIVATLVALALASMLARRGTFEWQGIWPISLLVFVGWSCISVFWSEYQWATLGSALYQVAFAFLAVYIALTRDFIQIVRIFGDVLRVVLIVSIGLEIFSGILVDTPLTFIGIAGNLADGGPIQGIEGSRNQLGLVALLGLVTFGTELLTTSVRRPIAIGSIVLASLTIIFSQSPVSFGVLLVLGVVSFAILGLRRISKESRKVWQIVLAAVAAVTLAIVWTFRSRVLETLDATRELDYRLDLWHELYDLVRVNFLEGWGWVGAWRTEIAPFFAIDAQDGRVHESALNAYLDVWFQLGIVGLLAFVGFVTIAFGRSWVLATHNKSRIFVWPTLALTVLLVTSLAESSILVEAGWLTLTVCAVKSAQHLSWRSLLPELPGSRD